MRASVIVVSNNRHFHLEECLKCLCMQDCGSDNYEIVVVDDASEDDTWAMLENLKSDCEVKKIRFAERMGQAIARNMAIEQASGEIIIFVDSDAFACSGFVREHLESHAQSPRLIVDGPAVNITWNGPKSSLPFGSLPVRVQAFFDFGGACFVTVNTSVRKEHLLTCGAFDPDFSGTYGWEDTELGLRLRKMGLSRLKNRSAFVLHCTSGQMTADAQLSKRRQCGQNAILYYRKHPELSVRREIRLGLLSRGSVLDRLCRCMGAEVVGGKWRSKWPMKRIAANIMLQREYLNGLNDGIALYGLPDTKDSEMAF